MTKTIPIWLDCDPGIDDSYAILLAAFDERFNLLGISTVHGNSSVENTTKNALSILTLLNKTEINVYKGASDPLEKPPFHAEYVHGTTGLGNVDHLLPVATVHEHEGCIEAIADAIRSYPDELALVATGTMTNVAMVFAKYPELKQKVKLISIMGGAINLGNVTKYAEFNIFADPKAANDVLTDDVLAAKTIMIPLNLTHTAVATKEVRRRLLNDSQSVIRRVYHDLADFYANTSNSGGKFSLGPPVHDPLAVLAVLSYYGLDSDHLDYQFTHYKLRVIEKGAREGETEVVAEDPTGVAVGSKMNVERFWQTVYNSLDRAVS